MHAQQLGPFCNGLSGLTHVQMVLLVSFIVQNAHPAELTILSRIPLTGIHVNDMWLLLKSDYSRIIKI